MIMSFYVNYKDGDIYNDKVVTRVFVTRQMNPHRKDRLGHYVCWKDITKELEGKCTLHLFGLNHHKHRNVQQGVNDIATVAPWMIPWFKDPNVPYTHTVTSKHKVDFICPYCGMEVKNKIISNVCHYNKVVCPNCGDGISYPERFLSNLLTICGVDFEFHKIFLWSNGREYDFYIKPLNMIIETHGKQHYTNTWSSGADKKYAMPIQDNDVYKEELASAHGIKHYVILDCQKSDYMYIENSIKSSILVDYFDFSNIDWRDIGVKSSKSIFMNVIESYLAGICREDTIDMFKISDYTYHRYLRKAKKLGLIDRIIRQPRKITSTKTTAIGRQREGRVNSNELTPREIQVCSLAVQDLEFKEIAQILGVAYTTVVTYKENSYKKLNVHNKKELIQLYNSSETLKNLLDNVNVCHERSETVTVI